MRATTSPLFGLTLVASFACATAASCAEVDDATLKAAKAEGTVVALVPIGNAEVGPLLIAAFEKRYGIKLELEFGRGPGHEEKIRTQQQTKRVLVDVLISGEGPYIGMLPALEPYDVPNTPSMASVIKQLAFPPTPIYANLYGFLVSTTRLKEADYPRKWDDLNDPKYRGELIMDDLTRAGGLGAFISVVKAKGEGYWIALAKQNPRITPQYPENENAVARGEYGVYVAAQVAALFRLGKTAEVKFIKPEDGLLIGTTIVGQIKGAPHPNATRVLINFLLSPQAQTIFADNGLVPVLDGIAVPLPEMAIDNVKLLARRTPEDIANQEASSKSAAKIFNILQ